MSRSYKDLTNPSTLKTETFQYDGLDRLRYAQVTGLQLQEVNYNPSGNIISKSGLGNYTYDQSKTNSLLSVGNTDQLIPSTSQNIQYNYHNKPDLITEGVLEYSLLYGADNQRIKSTLKNNSTEIRTMFYGPGYEKVVTPDSIWESCYISSPYGAEAIVVKKGTIERLYYIEKDHLGSIVGLISSTGSYVERHSYDSWGRRRNPSNWSFDNVPESKLTSWGYTGQEHLDMFGLINMNGRVYDPVTSRFLNVDPIVQSPYNSQDYNSYSYCANNPLNRIDPSGFSYLKTMQQTYSHKGEGFWYRGSYYAWDDELECFFSSSGKALSSGGHYSYNASRNTYHNENGKEISFRDVLSEYIYPYAMNVDWMTLHGTRSNPYQHIGLVYFTDGSVQDWDYWIDQSWNLSSNTRISTVNTVAIDKLAKLCGGLIESAFGIFAGSSVSTRLFNSYYVSTAKVVSQYTKSSLSFGREMHTAYKASLADDIFTFKEFTKIKGIRSDFVDFNTKTIYELKPFNPRQIKLGSKQLNYYRLLFEQRYGGIWKTVLDFY